MLIRSSRARSRAFRGAAPLFVATLAAGPVAAQTAAPAPDAAAAAPAAYQGTVPDVVVQAQQQTDTEKAAAALAQVPGGTAIVSSEQIDQKRAANLADVLSGEPGVFAQSTAGGEAIRLSIRGSGIQRSPLNYAAGVSELLDGLPLLTATGAPWELIEPLAMDHIDVLRGGNSFDYGVLTLGGAINFVSHTGYNSSPFQARFEGGSFGYLRGQVSSGQVIGPFDYYVSATGFDDDGYRNHSQTSSARFSGNIGYQVSPTVETRFYFDFAHEYFQVPYTLTWAQLEANPQQANPTAAKYNWYKLIPASEFVGDKTKVTIDDASAIEFGFDYQNFPQNGAGGPFVYWTASDIGGLVKYTRTDNFGGHQSNTQVSVVATDALNTNVLLTGWPGWFQTSVKGQPINAVNYGGADVVLLGVNDFQALSNLWINSGLALSYAPRSSIYTFPAYDPLTKDYNNYAPRLGLRYYLTPDVQVFGNVTRSVEPPTDWSLSAVLVPGTNLNLKEQTAWTGEVGTRGKAGIFQWNVDYYHSWVENELLTVALPGSTLTVTSNASPTMHQGVELGLDALLWQSNLPSLGGVGNPLDTIIDPTQQQILLRQAYTWSDFRYVGDPLYGTNRLPGIPINFYKATLEYRHPSGFYVGANVESVFNAYPVDYANTFYSRPYAILGARIGYAPPKKPGDAYQWEAFFEGKNLNNVKYASAVIPVYNAHGQDVSAFYPGDGLAFTAGLAYRY